MRGVRVGERQIGVSLRSFAPIQGNPRHEERIVQVVAGELLGFGPHAGNFLASLPLRVDRDAPLRHRAGASSNFLDLSFRQPDVSAPVGEGSFRDRDQFSDLAVREAEAAEGFAEFGTLPAVEVAPLSGSIEKALGYVRSHANNILMRCDRKRA